MPQEKFHYKSLEEVKQRAAELGVDLPFAADTHALVQPLTVRNICLLYTSPSPRD